MCTWVQHSHRRAHRLRPRHLPAHFLAPLVHAATEEDHHLWPDVLRRARRREFHRPRGVIGAVGELWRFHV